VCFLFLDPEDEVGPSISSSVVLCSFVLLVYIVVLDLVFYLCPSLVRVLTTFAGTVLFPLLCSGKYIPNVQLYIVLLWMDTLCSSSSSSSVICHTTGPKPLPKRFLHLMRSRASSFKWENPLLSPRSSSNFLRLPPRLLVTSLLPNINMILWVVVYFKCQLLAAISTSWFSKWI
jgi:hypothetical protein